MFSLRTSERSGLQDQQDSPEPLALQVMLVPLVLLVPLEPLAMPVLLDQQEQSDQQGQLEYKVTWVQQGRLVMRGQSGQLDQQEPLVMLER